MVPAEHHLYADTIVLDAGSVKLDPARVAPAVRKRDEFSGEDRDQYEQSFTSVYRLVGYAGGVLNLRVRYQGCSKAVCFLPATRVFAIGPDGTAREVGAGAAARLTVRAGRRRPTLFAWRGRPAATWRPSRSSTSSRRGRPADPGTARLRKADGSPCF